jgi:hypothetical protein
VPILAVLDSLIFDSSVFDKPGGSPGDGIQLVFLLVLAPVWFGCLTSAREIVKERALRQREAAFGVRLGAYLISKCAVLFVVVTAQVTLFFAILAALRPLDESAADHLGILALVVVGGFGAVALGLLVSSLVTSEDQAMTIIPLVVIPQLLFAGALVPAARMLEPFQTLGELHLSQWLLASVGTQMDFNDRMAQSPEFAQVNRFGTEFFDVGIVTGLCALALFVAAFIGATAFVLSRREAAPQP